MSYPEFHLIFLLPPAMAMAAMMWWGRMVVPKGWSGWGGIALLVAVALGYTIPWEVMMIRAGVWGYGEGVVVGTLWGIPYGEAAFIVIQTVLTSVWANHVWNDSNPAISSVRGSWWHGAGAGTIVMLVGAAFCMAGEQWTYLGAILVWAGPVLAMQWAFGWRQILDARRSVAAAVWVPTVYLWVADWIALSLGLWVMSPDKTTGVKVWGLPIEEAAFFLVTNSMVVQGIVLWQWALGRRGIPAVSDGDVRAEGAG